MSGERERGQAQLEQATSRVPAAGGSLDPETAELRATWEAFGRLLDAADQDFDEAAFRQRLATVARPPRRHSSAWVAVLAAAALVLLTVTIGWWAVQRLGAGSGPASPEIVETPAPQVDQVATDRTRTPAPAAPDSGSAPPKESLATDTVAADAELSWDDQWDERLAQVDRVLIGLRTCSYSGDASLQMLDEQLQQIGKDLERGLGADAKQEL